jgi:predicted amidohydrolase
LMHNQRLTFRAAAAAMHVVHDKAANLEKIHRLIQQAAQEGVKLLTLPEGALQGFIFHPHRGFDPRESRYFWEQAETVPGPSTLQIAAWASQAEMYVAFGLWQRVDHPATPILHNSAVLLGPEGIVGQYHKVHQPVEELHHYRPGVDWPVFSTPLAHMGMMICYDQCFPEAARELSLKGAEILLVPNAWPKSDQASDDRYGFFGRARAAENNRWLLQSNQVGPSDKGDFSYLGYSRIIDPAGMVVARTEPMQEGLAIAEISPTKYEPTRARSGWYLQQRVPSTYTTLTDSKPFK